jgi:hypothetical protein
LSILRWEREGGPGNVQHFQNLADAEGPEEEHHGDAVAVGFAQGFELFDHIHEGKLSEPLDKIKDDFYISVNIEMILHLNEYQI